MAHLAQPHTFNSTTTPNYLNHQPEEDLLGSMEEATRGFIKINFDGSKSSQGAAGGFIIHDWEGKFIQVSAFNLRRSSILIVEATAMRNGIKEAVQAGFTHI